MKRQKTKKLRTKKYYVRWLCVILCVVLLLAFMNCTCWVGDRSLIPFIENYAMPTITKNPSVTATFNQEKNRYELDNTSTEPYRILQISDIHLGLGVFTINKDKQAVKAVYDSISATKPDLIVVTGDALSPFYLRSGTKNSYNQLDAFILMMERTGIDWTFCFGNHDRDCMASLEYISDRLENTENCLYQGGDENISGKGNFVIALKNMGELSTALFIMDSGGGSSVSGYDGVHEDQIEWYAKTVNELKAEKADVKTHLYMHMPLTEYRTAWELAEQNSDKVTKFYGEKGESISSGVQRGFYDKIVELDSTKWVYCGHDHDNNFSILMKDTGVRFTYGMGIDYSAYIGIQYRSAQRGVTLSTIAVDGTVKISRAPQDYGYTPIDF